jgi:DNA polymerase elongation subunit (family B)
MSTDLKFDLARFLQGAFVLPPNPEIVSLKLNNGAILIVDFSSLYPTIRLLYNSSYFSIKLRFYDTDVIDTFLNTLRKFDKLSDSKQSKMRETLIDTIVRQLVLKTKRFLDKTETGEKKNSSDKQKKLDIINEVYSKRLRRVFKTISLYGLDNLLTPMNKQTYFVFTNDLLTLFEVLQLISGDNELAINMMTRPQHLFTDYDPNQTVYFVDDIHDRSRKLVKTTIKEFWDSTIDYIINPYGVMTLKHEVQMSPDITRIETGLKTRSAVKNLGLVAEALGVSLADKLGNKVELQTTDDLMKMRDSLDNYIKKLMDKFKDEALNQLLSKDSNELIEFGKSKIVHADTIKVINNSDYGVNGVKSYKYSSPFVSNSITTGARITGLKLLIYLIDKEFTELTLGQGEWQ